MARLTAEKLFSLNKKHAPEAAAIYGLNAYALAQTGLGISAIETGDTFNTDAKNKTSTATGLFQINKITLKEVIRILKLPKDTPMEKLYDPDFAARAGMAILAYRIHQNKKHPAGIKAGVIAYNQGNAGKKAMKAAAGYYNAWVKFMKKYAGVTGEYADVFSDGKNLAGAFH